MNTRWASTITTAVILAGAAVAPLASAQPPGFPDLSGFTDVTADFAGNQRGETVVGFSPDGLINCGFDSQRVTCAGPMPGLQGMPIANGNTQGNCDEGSATAGVPAGGGGQIRHNKFNGQCPDESDVKILKPGQKVSYGNITCGVAPGGVTACIDTFSGEHGFVLQPSGSWSF